VSQTNPVHTTPYFLSKINYYYHFYYDRLCGLVTRVSGYRSRGPGSIPGATRLSEKQWVWTGIHPASWIQLRSSLKKKVAAPV
jgi:hypothetical protein